MSSGPSFRKVQYPGFVWIDICEPDKTILDQIAEEYGLDFFQISDSLQSGHLPKYEKQPGYEFLILRAVPSTIDKDASAITELSNKIAFFYNGHKLITIHRKTFAFLADVRNDYNSPQEMLLHLIHKMVQTYHPPLDELDEQILEIEKFVFIRNYNQVSLQDMYFLKTRARIMKKLLQLFQQVVASVEVSDVHKTSLQDIRDNLLSLILSYDEVLENANNLLNTYLSVNAQKSNDVMKLLTIFSAFFLPLTFIAGIYGMNFENMPELKWPNGYYLILGVMLGLAILIYLWFRRKRIL